MYASDAQRHAGAACAISLRSTLRESRTETVCASSPARRHSRALTHGQPGSPAADSFSNFEFVECIELLEEAWSSLFIHSRRLSVESRELL
mmetsp:Transcript_34769/g.91381  ORF Transcript_34769/g.91381 Transcript_34769/m.91381 type:complete len:91 (-) Transcript_34769:1200-1472(-)